MMMRRQESGLSLLELLISVGLFVGLTSGLSGLLVSGSNTYQLGMTVSFLEARARRVVDRLANDLVAAGIGTLTPAPEMPFGATTVTFQKAVGYDAGTVGVVWGNPMTFETVEDPMDPANGNDDDGDGLIDERELHVVTDVGLASERRVVLMSGVACYLEGEIADGGDNNGNGLVDEMGLSFVLKGQRLAIRLSVQAVIEGHLLTRTVETLVSLRN